MSSSHVVISLARLEGLHLATLVDEFRELVSDRDIRDSALQRLTPSAYPDDLEAANSFAESTRDDLLDRRAVEALVVSTALRPYTVSVDGLTEQESLATVDLSIEVVDLDAWLRTLTAIRLVIADRLGITSEEPSTAGGPADIYEWLGYRLEMLIQAADEADSRGGR